MQLNSDTIRHLRCRMGWSRSELAHRLGVQSQLVGAWETGAQKPTQEQTQFLENLFRRSEAGVLEMLETPQAEKLLDAGKLESVNLRDLVRDNSRKSSR